MSIVLVDNNANELSWVANEFTAIFPELQIQSFTDPLMSAKYICNNEVAAAFLAATMRPVDGLTLLRTLRANKPTLPIVMLLDSETQREAALCEPVTGCLVKPVSAKGLESIVKRILFSQSKNFTWQTESHMEHLK